MQRPNDGDWEASLARGIALLRARWTRVNAGGLTLQVLFYALLAGAAAALAFPDLSLTLLLAAVSVAAAVTGLAWALAIRPSDVLLAKHFDDTAGLKDRVSSALELRGSKGAMVDVLREDASAASAALVPATVVPMRIPREGYWMPLPIVLVIAAAALGDAWGREAPRDPALEQALEERIAALEDLLSEEDGERKSERHRELAEELEKLKAKLSPEATEKKDAMEEVARLREQIEQQRENDEEQLRELRQKLEELQPGEKDSDLEQALNRGDYAEALRRVREMQEELKKKLENKDKKLTEEELAELEKLAKKLQDIEAKLMRLMQIDLDLQMMGDVIDFLADFEGELADLEDFDPSKVLKLKDLDPSPP